MSILKAVEEGRIVGSVDGRMDKGHCLVGRLMVHPTQQGRGLGTALMAAIEKEFPQAQAYQLFTGELSGKLRDRLHGKAEFRFIIAMS